MFLPFVIFWVLIAVGRKDLGIKGVSIALVFGIALLAGFFFSGLVPYYWVVPQSLLDIVLILFLFGGDIRIN